MSSRWAGAGFLILTMCQPSRASARSRELPQPAGGQRFPSHELEFPPQTVLTSSNRTVAALNVSPAGSMGQSLFQKFIPLVWGLFPVLQWQLGAQRP